ncbi:hypothetical protein GE21DRAFT_3456 [Neurospora crassa]|uniref:Uncharacterized protein n=2 Tax=Neurospora crassa TaxID=5141 RepID=Q1K5J3_NEUCR|nr:hypothetical protein NCU01530 [Neurospora crassa OR74A]EAA27743.1 hypothetical protein NCU01530 [Neurospora crassa OR74A]KHE87212.1 hypothetical protein GE21DRAFT_3456 [Neurospora crassa]CAD21217.1 hypothetical protein [Neurospora crassa]|eukprot:XP_956979.1 hypothetical protein NCU01530 [Neurospora crassa OR74A]
MTSPGPNDSQSERLHPATSSSLSQPPSSPAALLTSQPKPPSPLPPRITRSKSVPPILPSRTANSAPTTSKPKPTYSEIACLYQYIWDRIDDLKIITGDLCQRLIALEDTVAALDEGDNVEIFTRKALDMATEGQLIAMIAEKFREMGTKIADRGTDVGLGDGDYGKEGGDGVDIKNRHGDENENGDGNGGGEENTDGNGSGTQKKNQGREKRKARVSKPDTDSDPDL